MSRSGYYHQKKQKEVTESELEESIINCFKKHHGNYGRIRIRIELQKQNIFTSEHYIAKVLKNGFIFKHTKNVGQRVDLKDEANIKRVQEFMRKLNLFQTDYIEKMNSFALAKVSDKDIQEYVLNLFLDDEKLKEDARLHNYNYDLTETSTRTKNIISSFMDTLESGVGQDTNRGTKLWVFNGTTNFLSNTASYGSAKDTESVRASKRFDSLMEGTANKRMERAMELLAA